LPEKYYIKAFLHKEKVLITYKTRNELMKLTKSFFVQPQLHLILIALAAGWEYF